MARPKHIYSVRKRLLEEPQNLQWIKSWLGVTVESIVRACLQGPVGFGLDEDCDEEDIKVKTALQAKFHELVVKKLAQIKGL